MTGDRYLTRPGKGHREREVFDLHTGRPYSVLRGEKARERAEKMADELNRKEGKGEP